MGGRELLPLSRTSQNIFGTRVSYNHEFTDHIVTVVETWKSVVSPGSLTFTEGVRSKQGSLCSPFYHRSRDVLLRGEGAALRTSGGRGGALSGIFRAFNYGALAETSLGTSSLAQFVARAGPWGTVCFYRNTCTVGQVTTLLRPKIGTSQP